MNVPFEGFGPEIFRFAVCRTPTREELRAGANKQVVCVEDIKVTRHGALIGAGWRSGHTGKSRRTIWFVEQKPGGKWRQVSTRVEVEVA